MGRDGVLLAFVALLATLLLARPVDARVLRVCAELHSDPLPWLALAALGWLLAFLPWVLRSAWIYLTPRADGKAG